MTDVTQEDRDLFKALFHHDDEDGARFVDQGLFDDHRRMRAIAAHRIAAERKGMMEAAGIIEKRMDIRFAEHGTHEPDTNACYYEGTVGELYEALDEEAEELIQAIRQRATAIETAGADHDR